MEASEAAKTVGDATNGAAPAAAASVTFKGAKVISDGSSGLIYAGIALWSAANAVVRFQKAWQGR